MRQLSLLVVLVVGVILVGTATCMAQSRWISEVAGEPIPKDGYKSWSLFLINNPDWLRAKNNERLRNLYEEFQLFGDVIGPKHLATWFWKAYSSGEHPMADNKVDVSRCSMYCAKFGLLPSESPHVLVTTKYPDLNEPVGDYCVLKFNGANAEDITALLIELANQLLVQGLNQKDLDSEAYWLGWQHASETVWSGMASFTKKVKLTINTQVVKVEIGG